MFECSHCGKVFKYESECKRHELSHLPGFGCDKCGKKFTYLSALRRHQKLHERQGNIQCDKCNHSFKDETLLKRHIKYAHEGTYICSECNAKFNSKQALGIHILIHKPKSERKYSCSFKNCYKTFNFSHHLKCHELTHTNSKQHFCKICGKGFIQAQNLKAHMKIHVTRKWFPCEMNNCRKKFVSEYARKRHHAKHGKPVCEKGKPLVFCTSSKTEDTLSSFSKQLSLSPCSQQHHEKFEKNVLKDFTIYISNEETTKHVLLNNFREPEEVVTCKAVLGKCLMTGDLSMNENCLCDQMVKSNNDCNKTIKVLTSSDNIEELRNPMYKDDVTESTCEGCSCILNKSENEESQKKICSENNHLPEFEFGFNGTVKLINTIDIEFEGIVSTEHNTVTRKNDYNGNTHITRNIPYNSCKAVLGKCIVSGNGMINEDCLCAKMAIDERQMTTQEIEEITPQCSDSSMCL